MLARSLGSPAPRRLVHCALLAMAGSTAAAQAVPRSFGELRPGPHRVGYRVQAVVDSSRVVADSVDWLGDPATGSRYRGFRLHLWYPAEPASSASSLRYRDYVVRQRSEVVEPTPEERARIVRQDLGFAIGNYRFLNEARWSRLLDEPFLAVPDAAPARGAFPVLVGHLRPMSTLHTNEYLASHGFVVAMVQIPPGPAAGSAGLEALAEDMEHALLVLRRAGIGSLAAGAYGFSGAGFAQLILAMKNRSIRALATIESGYFGQGLHQGLRGTPLYDPSRLTTPFLYQYSDVLAREDRFFSAFDSLSYSRRYHFLLHNPSHNHWDYASEGMMAATVIRERGEEDVRIQRGFEAANRHLLWFFDAHLKGDASAERALEASAGASSDPALYSLRILPGAPRLPSADELAASLGRRPERAAELLDRVLATPGGPALLTEPLLNRIGYQLAGPATRRAALVVLERAAARFPQSANAADSYAELLETAGDTAGAVRMAREALSRAASQPGLAAETRRQLETINRQRLTRLGERG